LLRDLCVEREKWLDAREFEDAIAACNLLPGPGAGAGAAVPAVAVQAGTSLLGASWQRRKHTIRWLIYLTAGITAGAAIGVWLVLVLLGCGAIELTAQHAVRSPSPTTPCPTNSTGHIS
jgi:chromate transporter